jgi:branched-chain amino acid transport system substrate-binding protein
VLDNQSSISLLTEQVHTLVLQDHAVALVSGCCDLNVAEAPLANALKVPLVGTAIPNELIGKDNGTWAWNIYIDLFDPTLFTAAVPSLGATNKQVALIASSDPEGEGANQVTTAEAAAGGYKIAAQSLVPVGTTDFSSFIEQAQKASAQVLVAQMPGPDCFALWKQMKALGYVPKVTVANQCGANPTWAQLGSLGNGALLGMNWTPTSGLPNAQAVAATFNKTYPGDVVNQEAAVSSYSAMQVLLAAISRAGSTSAAQVNAAIGKTNGPFPLGTIKFDSSHDWGGPTFLAQWQNGKVVQVYPKAGPARCRSSPSASHTEVSPRWARRWYRSTRCATQTTWHSAAISTARSCSRGGPATCSSPSPSRSAGCRPSARCCRETSSLPARRPASERSGPLPATSSRARCCAAG